SKFNAYQAPRPARRETQFHNGRNFISVSSDRNIGFVGVHESETGTVSVTRPEFIQQPCVHGVGVVSIALVGKERIPFTGSGASIIEGVFRESIWFKLVMELFQTHARRPEPGPIKRLDF